MKQTLLAFCGITVWLILSFTGHGQTADMILLHGKIFTADAGNPFVQALAIRGNRVLATGTDADIQKLSGSHTRRIDLRGRTVVPGLNNAHDHLGWGYTVAHHVAAGNFSVEGPDRNALIDSIARLAGIARKGQWISADIGMKALGDPGMRAALDSVSPDNPVWLQVMWGHGSVLNSLALKDLGIPDTAADPLGGWYARVPGSRVITGALFEYAQWPVWYGTSLLDRNLLVNGLRGFAAAQVAAGITTVQNMGSMIDPRGISDVFRDAALPIRVRIIPMPGTSGNRRELEAWKLVEQRPSPLTYTSGIKYVIDGTPLEQTAFMKRPYPGGSDWYGRLNFPEDSIRQILREALDSNTQLMMHIVGDSTLDIVLRLMKEMAPGDIWKQRRVRFEHNATPLIKPWELAALAEMGIVVMHTPKYNRTGHIRSLLDRGVLVGIAPDGTTNPFVEIMLVCSGQDDASENISREQAVIAFTKTNAYAEFAEGEKGMLTKGMLADLAVLSQDIFTVPVQAIPATRSELTIIDGKIVYSSTGNPPK